MNKLKILLTGANGQLGMSLTHLPGISDQITWIPTDYQDLDITRRQSVDTFFRLNKPDCIINCAAYTAVDQAEQEPEQAMSINALGPENLALAAKSLDIPFIHISTDYVFSGKNWRPYLEVDPADPQSVYGKTKYAGEQAILQTGGKAIIVRTSWLYSEYGKNFFLTMLRLGSTKEAIGVVADQVGSPTFAGDLAVGLVKIVHNHFQHPDWIHQPEIFHFCNAGVASWYDFSTAIMEAAGLNCKVNPLSTEQYPSPTPRPYYSVLNTQKFRSTFLSEIPHWRTSVPLCLEKYKKGQNTI